MLDELARMSFDDFLEADFRYWCAVGMQHPVTRGECKAFLIKHPRQPLSAAAIKEFQHSRAAASIEMSDRTWRHLRSTRPAALQKSVTPEPRKPSAKKLAIPKYKVNRANSAAAKELLKYVMDYAKNRGLKPSFPRITVSLWPEPHTGRAVVINMDDQSRNPKPVAIFTDTTQAAWAIGNARADFEAMERKLWTVDALAPKKVTIRYGRVCKA